ncbi:MAG: uncharacterized protein QOH93_2658 [Chloroflexia bacterium]|jgi:general stress protein YciG|nr:uncharacterized protein [Chloroflexia bacterium]
MKKMNAMDENGGGGSRRRGFAAMKPEQQREIARKGGQTVSSNRDYMAEIGRKGGIASHGGGRRGGSARAADGNS